MTATEKPVNFIMELTENLQANNIAKNITSLRNRSSHIELLLEEINVDDDNRVAGSNLKSCKDAVKATLTAETVELLNEYVKLGDFLEFLILEIKDDELNLKHVRKIAIHYLEIARLARDERIKRIAFSIADKLSP
jgi:hypothetical protein